MTYETLLYNLDGNVATITFNRSEVYNACNEQLKKDLLAALNYAGQDSAVRCVVVTGAGKAFSAGQDLRNAVFLPDGSIDFSGMIRTGYNPIIRAMRDMPKPILAAINGVAAGAGLALALGADMRIMSAEARLVEGFTGIALVPDSGATYFFARMMNYPRAFEFVALNEPILAQDALTLGLVNRVAPAAEFAEATQKLALQLANAPTKTLGMVKKMLQTAMTASLDEILEIEADQQQIAGSSEDHRIGVMAFGMKQTPQFVGR